MMVLFSRFMGTRPRGTRGRSSKKGVNMDKLWMSDTQLLKVKESEDFSRYLSERYSDEVKDLYTRIAEQEEALATRVRAGQAPDYKGILPVLKELAQKDLLDQVYEYAFTLPGEEESPARTAMVVLAAMKIGKARYETKGMLKVGLAAFFEDVGAYRLDGGNPANESALNGERDLRGHPEASAQLIDEMGEPFRWMSDVALQVYERTDGSGYPKGLEGDEISEFASVVGLVKSYVEMITRRGPEERLTPVEAVKFLVREEREKFPPEVLKEFLNQISLYPVNTFVRLNNQSIARVLSTGSGQPLRPTIELLYDGLGKKVEKDTIVDLSSSPLLHIVGTIDEKESD